MPKESSSPDPKIDLMRLCAKVECRLCATETELDPKTGMHVVGTGIAAFCSAAGINRLIMEYRETGRIVFATSTDHAIPVASSP